MHTRDERALLRRRGVRYRVNNPLFCFTPLMITLWSFWSVPQRSRLLLIIPPKTIPIRFSMDDASTSALRVIYSRAVIILTLCIYIRAGRDIAQLPMPLTTRPHIPLPPTNQQNLWIVSYQYTNIYYQYGEDWLLPSYCIFLLFAATTSVKRAQSQSAHNSSSSLSDSKRRLRSDSLLDGIGFGGLFRLWFRCARRNLRLFHLRTRGQL